MPDHKKSSTVKERELIMRAKQGDEASFEALILSCKGKAYNIAYRYMRNEEDALDVMQESFIKIYRHLEKFNEQSQFDTWVYRIVVNACNDMLRKNKNKTINDTIYKNKDSEDVFIEIADKGPRPDEILENKEKSKYILSCLEKTGHDHKEILILRDIQGFSYEQIAQILNCSMGTVKSRLSRARLKLKEIYLAGKQSEQIEDQCV